MQSDNFITGSIKGIADSLAAAYSAVAGQSQASEDIPRTGSQVRLQPEAMPGAVKTAPISTNQAGLGFIGLLIVGSLILWYTTTG